MRIVNVLFWILIAGVLACSGCARKSALSAREEVKLVVPVCQTAQEQHAYAAMYQKTQLIGGSQAKQKEQLGKIIQCYESVVVNFPDDQEYTPLAYLEIADCVKARALITIGRTYDQMGRHQEAKNIYRELMDRFGASQNPRIRPLVKRAETYYYTLKEEGKKQR